MPLTHFDDIGLLPFCEQLELKFVKFFYGTNPGCWDSRLPYNRFLFILDSDGKNSLRDENQNHLLARGDWILIPAFHKARHNHNNTMLHLSVHFSLTVCGCIDLLSNENMFFSNHDLKLINEVIEQIKENDVLSLAISIQKWSWNILHQLLPERIAQTRLSAIYTNPVYAELLNFLWKHASARTRVGDMATFAKMGKESFVKKFGRNIGCSPGKFLDRVLIARATKMLSDTSCSIKEVSETLKFCDQFYFSRFFRKQTGLSPRDFRKRFPRTLDAVLRKGQ